MGGGGGGGGGGGTEREGKGEMSVLGRRGRSGLDGACLSP